MEKYNYVMALLSATHDMIKTHKTRAHENTSSIHDLLHMKKMHHNYLLRPRRSTLSKFMLILSLLLELEISAGYILFKINTDGSINTD